MCPHAYAAPPWTGDRLSRPLSVATPGWRRSHGSLRGQSAENRRESGGLTPPVVAHFLSPLGEYFCVLWWGLVAGPAPQDSRMVEDDQKEIQIWEVWTVSKNHINIKCYYCLKTVEVHQSNYKLTDVLNEQSLKQDEEKRKITHEQKCYDTEEAMLFDVDLRVLYEVSAFLTLSLYIFKNVL